MRNNHCTFTLSGLETLPWVRAVTRHRAEQLWCAHLHQIIKRDINRRPTMVSMRSRMVRISALEAHAEATERGDTSTSASSTLKGAV